MNSSTPLSAGDSPSFLNLTNHDIAFHDSHPLSYYELFFTREKNRGRALSPSPFGDPVRYDQIGSMYQSQADELFQEEQRTPGYLYEIALISGMVILCRNESCDITFLSSESIQHRFTSDRVDYPP